MKFRCRGDRLLTVYDFPSIDSAGLYIAEQDGLFSKEGLAVGSGPHFVMINEVPGPARAGDHDHCE